MSLLLLWKCLTHSFKWYQQKSVVPMFSVCCLFNFHCLQCMDSYHCLQDTESCKVYLLLGVHLISFFLVPRTQKQWLFVSWELIVAMCPCRGMICFLWARKDLPKVDSWNNLCLAQISIWNAFLVTSAQVLPMPLLSEIQTKRNKVPCELSM